MKGTLTERCLAGEGSMRELARMAERLENDVERADREANSLQRENEKLRDELADITDAKPILEDLEDLRRGILDCDDLYERYLAAAVPA